MFEKNQVVFFGYSIGHSEEAGNKMQTADSQSHITLKLEGISVNPLPTLLFLQ